MAGYGDRADARGEQAKRAVPARLGKDFAGSRSAGEAWREPLDMREELAALCAATRSRHRDAAPRAPFRAKSQPVAAVPESAAQLTALLTRHVLQQLGVSPR
jgi:hypothetical protein